MTQLPPIIRRQYDFATGHIRRLAAFNEVGTSARWLSEGRSPNESLPLNVPGEVLPTRISPLVQGALITLKG